jgi:Tfp pilus assembly protein PilZ
VSKTSENPSGRRYTRHAISLSLEISVGDDESLQAHTTNVGFGGMFVDTPKEIPVGVLVEVKASLPSQDQQLILSATVVRRRPSSGSPLGVGLKLFGNDRPTRARWVTFIKSLEEKGGS